MINILVRKDLPQSSIGRLAVAAVASVGMTLAVSQTAIAATFRYTTVASNALFTEGSTVVSGTTYDGTFLNTILDPFSASEQTFSGLYQIKSGQLGQAVSLLAVQQNPIDRTDLGAGGITQIDYLDMLQPVSAVPGAVLFPPTITEFDFKLTPAALSGAPVALANGWVVETVPEPATTFALLGFLALGAGLKSKQTA